MLVGKVGVLGVVIISNALVLKGTYTVCFYIKQTKVV